MFNKTLRVLIQTILLQLLFFTVTAQTNAQAQAPFHLGKFVIPTNPIEISRNVRQGIYFDAAGRRSAILGIEEGRFEAWVYPLKLFHDCRLMVSIEGGDANIDLSAYAKRITATPESVNMP